MEQFPVTLDMYTTVVGFFLPMIIAIINKATWGQRLKYGISFAVVCLAAAFHLVFMGQFDLLDIPVTILKILTLTIGSYLVFWRPSGISDKIENNINK